MKPEGASPGAPGFERPTFEELYASARIWLPAELRRLGVRDDTEDLLQEVLIIAHRKLKHFDAGAAPGAKPTDPARALRAWILGIAWPHVTKRRGKALRYRARLGSASVAGPSEQEPSAEDIATAAERRRILAGVLAKIQPRRAEVLVLYAIFDMTAPDIARELGVNENTVKSRISRGRDEARRAIERLSREYRSALQDLEDAKPATSLAASSGGPGHAP